MMQDSINHQEIYQLKGEYHNLQAQHKWLEERLALLQEQQNILNTQLCQLDI